ncbi:hypothetical protein PFISCL1PPCAC_9156, partial [Pristionchus fissidentatus]
KISAGVHWQIMKAECLEKLKVVTEDPRITSIMETIGDCLEETSDKSVRVGVLKLVTGIFSEKEIVTYTGASRYLVRLAKESSFADTIANGRNV